jgi:hypothetical protein
MSSMSVLIVTRLEREVFPSICGFTDLKKLPPELSTFLFCEYCKEPNLMCAFHTDLHYEYFKSKLSDIPKVLQFPRIDDDNK